MNKQYFLIGTVVTLLCIAMVYQVYSIRQRRLLHQELHHHEADEHDCCSCGH